MNQDDLNTVQTYLTEALAMLRRHADPHEPAGPPFPLTGRLVLRLLPSPHPDRNEGGSWQVVLTSPDPVDPVSWTFLSTQDCLLLLADLLATGGQSVGCGITIPDYDTSEYKTASEQWLLEQSLIPFGLTPATEANCPVCSKAYDPNDPTQRAAHDPGGCDVIA